QCLILSPEIREPLGVFKVSVRALHGLRLLCRSQIHHETFRDLTLARREMKNRDLSFLLGAPFPLTGKDKVGVIGLVGSRAPLSRPFPVKGKELGRRQKLRSRCRSALPNNA